MKRLLLIIALTATFAGCKKPPLECVYIVKPWFQDEEKGPMALCENAAGYIFYADTTEWAPADYDQALAGKITSRRGAGQRNFDLQATRDAEGILDFGTVTQQSVMVVVCHPDTRSYTYKQIPTEPGLAELVVGVTFRTWKTPSPFVDAQWIEYNQDPPVTVHCNYPLIPSVQQLAQGATVPAANAVGYAFWADTTEWKVTNFANALAGKISPVSGGQDRTADATALRSGNQLVFGDLTRRRVLLLVCDPDHRSWGVKQVSLPYNYPQAPAEAITFRTYETGFPYYGNGWKMTYEAPSVP